MTIKRLLVHLDNAPSAEARMEAAFGLAGRLGATLAAFYAVTSSDRRPLPSSGGASLESDLHARAAQAGVSVKYYEARYNRDPEINNALIVAARHCDMAIIGQRDPGQSGGSIPENVVEQMVTRAGRPVLVIPYAGRFPALGRRAVIAWNGSREAARALLDALPVLALAERVSVLSMSPGEEARPAMPNGLADIGDYLRSHGIVATQDRVTVDREQIEPADAFLSYLADTSADLAVVGAAGDSASKGWNRRSLTASILGNMTAPLLLSS